MLKYLSKKSSIATIRKIFEGDFEVIRAFERSILDEEQDHERSWEMLERKSMNKESIVRSHREILRRRAFLKRLIKEQADLETREWETKGMMDDKNALQFVLREYALVCSLEGLRGFKDFMKMYTWTKIQRLY